MVDVDERDGGRSMVKVLRPRHSSVTPICGSDGG